jgi:NAD(P)-dependent dehydrogenase (short-subunit alcohol dehydrogenase family)
MSVLEKFMLTGKKAVITGGARGIGQSIAFAFAEVGADIAVLDVMDATETIEKVRALGREAISIKIDVANEKDVERAFLQVEQKFTNVDVLFNNAGICINRPAENMTFEEWRQVVDVDLNAAFLVARAAGRNMIKNKRGGSIINTASMSGHIVNFPQEQCAYNSAKAGLIQLTKSLAVEWAKYNIRVNALSPGYVATPMTLRAPQEWKDVWFSMGATRRMCEPEELQGAALYLASNASTYTTGSDLIVDGAFTCT